MHRKSKGAFSCTYATGDPIAEKTGKGGGRVRGPLHAEIHKTRSLRTKILRLGIVFEEK